MVSCKKGPTRHAYAWQIGTFRQDTLDISVLACQARSLVITLNLHNNISRDKAVEALTALDISYKSFKQLHNAELSSKS